MKWQGRAILLPGIPLWLIMLGSIVFITTFLMFIIVGTYSRRVNVSGEVTTWPRAVNIYSGVQGFVVRQFVHEGQFSATVKTISRTPASTQEMLAYKGAPQNTPSASVPWYKVIATPEKQIIRYDEKYLPLENGMKAESTLFLEKRRIYQWMLSPFYDMKHSATGPIND